MEGLGHGATRSDLGSMRQILAATKPLETLPSTEHRIHARGPSADGFRTRRGSLFEVLPYLFSASQADSALAAAGRTAHDKAMASEDLGVVDRCHRRQQPAARWPPKDGQPRVH